MKPWHRTLSALAVTAATFPVGAQAAEIRRDSLDGVPVIIVEGQLEYGDEAKFLAAARGMPKAVVALDGPGGNLHAGMEIGKAIRARNYITAVPGSCASACALAWLGGGKRLVGPNGRVGFHAAWIANGGRSEVVAGGNALVGAYANQLGLSTSAVILLTSAGPREVRWLTPGEAQQAGIDVQWGGAANAVAPLRTASPAPVPTSPSLAAIAPSPARRADWTAYGEWVQVASRQSLDEAAAVARTIRQRNGNTNVFLYDNGWYAVTVGPFSPGRGRVALDAMVSAGEVPGDSLVTQGGRFSALQWGPEPRPRTTAQAYGGPGTLRADD